MLYRLADEEINSEVVVDSEDAGGYDMWQTNAHGEGEEHIDIHYNVYFFAVQNAEEILQGAQPQVSEVGPYSFKEKYNKFDIKWTDDGDTVTYNTQRYYLFNEKDTGSGLSLDDKLLLPNPSVIGFEYFLGQIPPAATAALNDQLRQKIVDGQATVDGLVQQVEDTINGIRLLPDRIKEDLDARLEGLRTDIDGLFGRLYDFNDESSPALLLLKTLLCRTPSGLSPFWEVDPFSAWFGWLNDPLLLEVQHLLDAMAEQSGEVSGWVGGV